MYEITPQHKERPTQGMYTLFTYENHNKDWGFKVELYAYLKNQGKTLEYILEFNPRCAWCYGGKKRYCLFTADKQTPELDFNNDIKALEAAIRVAKHPKIKWPDYVATKIAEVKRELVNPKVVQTALNF